MSSITVVAKVNTPVHGARLVVDTVNTFDGSPIYSPPAHSSNRAIRFTAAGLAANTDYYCAVELGGVVDTGIIGSFKTPPAAGPASFKCAFSGDASTGSNAAVFAEIIDAAPLFFIHLGDLHYEDIATDSLSTFLSAYNDVQGSAAQAALLRQVPTYYIWDDHDYGPNNSDGSAVGRNAACEAYRIRVPHPPLVKKGTTDPIYYSFQVGRVVFIVTDLRSESGDKDATDNASKSVLGVEQKAWMKSILSDPANDGHFFVWVCSRTFGAVPASGSDTWGGFTTERTELADYIKANCPGRVAVLSADMHSLAIDDGTNHDFATGGGEPIPTFQSSPLDRTGSTTTGGATYSEGGRFETNGQFGTMEVTDVGGADITITWKGFNASGTELVTYSFDVTLGVP